MRMLLFFIMSLSLIGCMDDFLAIKSDKKLVIPSTLQDFRALMDKADVMNQVLPYLGHISSDDFYISSNNYIGIGDVFKRNAYIWKGNIYEGTTVTDWNNSYQQIFYANNVLEGLKELKSQESEAMFLKGTALFFRSFAFYNLSQLFCEPYEIGGNNNGLGIPLRLEKDISKKVGRSSVEKTYQRIILDLEQAVNLLPLQTTIKTRPTKYAALLLLARVYLLMGRYQEALELSNEVMEHLDLIDFNTLDLEKSYPMEQFNQEVIFHSSIAYVATTSSIDYVDSTLMKSYDKNDIRRLLWFIPKDEHYLFKGNYTGGALLFNGLALDEAYLIYIECSARLNEWKKGKIIFQNYLEHRYSTGAEIDLSIVNSNNSMLNMVLSERRKSLLYRVLRWSDIRRLNMNYNANIVMIRHLGLNKYELVPKSNNYVLPIPDDVLFLSGIESNIRIH